MPARHGTAGKLREKAPRGERVALVTVLVLLAAACAPRPLLDRAIRARGGPLHSVVRQVEARVYTGFPGLWHWRTAFLAPDRYAWTIFTSGEPDHYLFDGVATRAFIGQREAALDPDRGAPLRTHARFTAVANLDVLRAPGVRVASLPAGELPPGTAAGLTVMFIDDGTRYRVAFDDRARLVWMAGPLALPPLGAGEVMARFTDFRSVDGFVLPFRTSYTFATQALADERTLAVCPNDPRLAERAFREPEALPDCGR